MKSRPDPDEIMTPDEVAKLLRVSRATLWRITKDRGLTGYRITPGKKWGRIRYFRTDVIAWLKRERMA